MIELFEFMTGYGYKVYYNDVLCVYQEYNPVAEGNVIMTYEEAEKFANEVLERIGGQ